MFGSNRSIDDMLVCEFCGKRYFPQVGFGSHMCEEGAEESHKRTAAWERNYKAGGKKVRYTIVVESYDSEDAISTAIGMAESMILTDTQKKSGSGKDELLENSFSYQRQTI